MSPAVRVFHRNQPFSNAITVYHPHGDLEIRPRLVADGKILWEGKPVPVRVAQANTLQRLPVGGTITLSEKTTPGPYILQVVLSNSVHKRDILTQWTDFELR